MMTWLLILAALWPLLWGFRLFLATRTLLALEVRRQRVLPIAPDALPSHLVEAAQPLIRQVAQLGFHLIGGWRIDYGANSPLNHDSIVLASADGAARATIRAHVDTARSGECFLGFQSTTDTGHEIITLAHGVKPTIPLPPGIALELVEGATALDLWQRHAARVAALGVESWRCADLETAVAREQMVCDAVFEGYRASGQYNEAPDGTLTYGTWRAVRRANAILRDAAKKKKAKQTLPPVLPVNLSPEARSTFDYEHYRRMVAFGRGRMTLRTKATMTLVSFLLFAAVLAWRTSPVVAITLLVALVVHEGGHLLGMRWFGFKDTQLLFLPFFGGAAVGHDDKVLPPWQHIVIILLGPLPGLFAGLAMLVVVGRLGGPAWLNQAALTTLVMNAFNLLPILPLDGGQIFDYAFASRFPRARVLFLAASALGLILVGLVLGSVKFLVIVGVLMLLQLRTEWRLAGIRRDVRAEYPDGGDEEPIVRRLLVEFREPEWKKMPMPQRLKHAQSLQNALRMPRPGFGTVCFAIAGYTAPVWLGASVAIFAADRAERSALAATEAKAEAAGLTTSAVRHPASVPPETNAAVEYAQAEALQDAARKAHHAERDAEVIRLLRAAAAKPVFVPPATPPTSGNASLVGEWTRGRVVSELLNAADERIRYGQPAEAPPLVLDALRLVRRMDTAPDWFPWDVHLELTTSSLSTLESALAAGATLTPEQVRTLTALLDEKADVDFAALTIPRTFVRRARVFDDMAKEGSVWLRLLLAATRLGAGTAQMRERSLSHAVLARDYLAQIRQGHWPEVKRKKEDERDGAMMMIAGLGDLVARERELRVALQWRQQARHNDLPRLEALGLPVAELVHPLTREPLRIEQRGALYVLAVSSGFAHVMGADLPKTAIEWRLPNAAAPARKADF